MWLEDIYVIEKPSQHQWYITEAAFPEYPAQPARCSTVVSSPEQCHCLIEIVFENHAAFRASWVVRISHFPLGGNALIQKKQPHHTWNLSSLVNLSVNAGSNDTAGIQRKGIPICLRIRSWFTPFVLPWSVPLTIQDTFSQLTSQMAVYFRSRLFIYLTSRRLDPQILRIPKSH